MTTDWLAHLPSATAPAWWGAVLSTILAVVKGLELWRDRFRIEVDGVFTSAIDIGNKIRIRNLSPKPIILSHWELFHVTGTWPFLNKTNISEMDFDNDGSTIPPHSVHVLTFADEDYFSTSHRDRDRSRIYIRMHIAGRRPVHRKVR